jgi:hypothetical protein
MVAAPKPKAGTNRHQMEEIAEKLAAADVSQD